MYICTGTDAGISTCIYIYKYMRTALGEVPRNRMMIAYWPTRLALGFELIHVYIHIIYMHAPCIHTCNVRNVQA